MSAEPNHAMSSYREFKPGPELDEVVARGWTRAAPPAVVGDELRILPDGSVDLIWSAGELLVSSPDRVARRHRVRRADEYVGVRLAPARPGR